MSLKVAQKFRRFSRQIFYFKNSPWPFKSSPNGENSPNLVTLIDKDVFLINGELPWPSPFRFIFELDDSIFFWFIRKSIVSQHLIQVLQWGISSTISEKQCLKIVHKWRHINGVFTFMYLCPLLLQWQIKPCQTLGMTSFIDNPKPLELFIGLVRMTRLNWKYSFYQ